MAIFYICGSLIAIGMNAENILPALKSVFVGAFTPQAVMGGAIGISIKEAVRFGVARGLFSSISAKLRAGRTIGIGAGRNLGIAGVGFCVAGMFYFRGSLQFPVPS